MSKSKIQGYGPKDAQLAIVGEAPGEKEVKSGKPFVGPAGRILNGWLRNAGIRKEQVYLDKVMHIRPPNDNFWWFKKNKKGMLQRRQKKIVEDILEVDPNLTILAGDEALEAFLGYNKITTWRGSVLPHRVGKVMPIASPEWVMKGAWDPFFALSMMDMSKAAEEMESPIYEEPFEWNNLYIAKDKKDALFYLEEALKADRVAIDIESIKGYRVATMFGFCWNWDEACCIPFLKGTKNRFTEEEEKEIWKKIDKLCQDGDVRKVAHNASFDVPALEQEHGVTFNNFWMDTMVAHHNACPEIPKALDNLITIYTNIPYYAEMAEGSGDDPAYYNCLDCLATYRISHEVEKDLKEQDVWKLFWTKSMPALRPAMEMQERGFNIDHEKREEKVEKLLEKREDKQRTLDEEARWHVNVNSPKQMKKFLYEQMNFDVRKHPRTGKPTTREEALVAIGRKTGHPIMSVILTIRHIDKLIGTYLDKDIYDEDGRARTSFNIVGAKTGRWSSSKTIRDTGMDLQNIPRKFVRDVFIPDEGMTLIAADYSQIESRIVAFLADDKAMKKVFKKGEDIHTRAAAEVLGIDLEEVTKDDRFKGKTVGHAANYGVGKRKYARELSESKQIGTDGLPEKVVTKKFPEQKAQARLNAYFNWAIGVKMWHKEVENKVRKSRRLRGPMGQQRIFFGRKSSNATYREAINWLPQSTVAYIINVAVANLFWSLPDECELLNQNHDEIDLQCPDEMVDEVVPIVRRAMTMYPMPNLEAVVDVEVGKDWQNTEEV